MVTETLRISPRFRGPSNSGNGGYVCGRIARHIDGTASVRLLVPPPLDVPLRIDVEDGVAVLRSETVRVGEGRAAELDLVPPSLPSPDQVADATSHFIGLAEHNFPRCFVCGPLRAEGNGMRIFPGPVEGRDLVAAPWIVDPSLSEGGRIPAEMIWAALDCPSAFVFLPVSEDRVIVLGELTARVDGDVHPHERCTTLAWPIDEEGRKHISGSAVFSEDGELVGLARATWIELPKRAFPAEDRGE